MNGRLEEENRKFTALEEKILNYPEYLTSWYMSLRACGSSSKTCADYINKVIRYLAFINKNVSKVKLSDLNYITVSKYYISIKTVKDEKGNLRSTSDSYQQTIWCCLNNFFKFLKAQHLVEENPMEMIKKPKNKDLDRINENRIRLDKFDFKDILRVVEEGAGSNSAKMRQLKFKERDMAIMLIFMTTGIRQSALRAINIEDIDFEEKTLSVIDKGAKWRKCKLTSGTMYHLSKWLEQRDQFLNESETHAVFISAKGIRLGSSSIEKLVNKYCEEALGYHISPHKLRSGFCSIMYTETGDIEKVRRIVGHANVSTTQRYIVTDGSERDEAAAIMTSIFG